MAIANKALKLKEKLNFLSKIHVKKLEREFARWREANKNLKSYSQYWAGSLCAEIGRAHV